MTLDLWEESRIQEEEDEIQASPSQSPYLSSSGDTFMVGFVIVNIVGLQHYSGTISGREMVGLVREPLNSFDANAIKVLNTRTIQVGHIERSAAAVLSPLVDSNIITVEGIVPNTPGNRFRYKLPCQIHIFARIDAFPNVKRAISRGGLQLISESDPSFALSESVIVKEGKSKKELRNLDEIFKLVGDENKRGGREILEPPKDVIKSELFLHQKEGLGWLVDRENSCELPPFWEEKEGVYVNVLTNYQTDKRPEPLRGGIFADDMGLGKTLTLLSLIALNKPVRTHHGRNVDHLEEGAEEDDRLCLLVGKKSKKGKSSKKVTGSRKKPKLNDAHMDNKVSGELMGETYESSSALVPKTTLIVCPPSVFSTWITQLAEHTKAGSFKVYMYYGERTRDAEELQKCDIVLTTYSTLAAEENWRDSPVKKIEWWRVILDEAHLIKNPAAQQSKAVTALKATRRWVVTGTPIQNGSFDLFSLMAFLRFEPFSIKSYWESLVQRPLDLGNQNGLSRLQTVRREKWDCEGGPFPASVIKVSPGHLVSTCMRGLKHVLASGCVGCPNPDKVLMATISLRRTKEKGLIGLPSKTVETHFVELSVEEREQYEQMEAEAKNVVQDYIYANSVVRNYSTVLGIILRLRQICNDVALCPSDIRSLLPSNNIEGGPERKEESKQEKKAASKTRKKAHIKSDFFRPGALRVENSRKLPPLFALEPSWANQAQNHGYLRGLAVLPPPGPVSPKGYVIDDSEDIVDSDDIDDDLDTELLTITNALCTSPLTLSSWPNEGQSKPNEGQSNELLGGLGKLNTKVEQRGNFGVLSQEGLGWPVSDHLPIITSTGGWLVKLQLVKANMMVWSESTFGLLGEVKQRILEDIGKISLIKEVRNLEADEELADDRTGSPHKYNIVSNSSHYGYNDVYSLNWKLADVSSNPELLKKMVSILQDGDDFDCPICISPPTKTIITCCAHIFCRSCILKTLKRTNPRCPLCRRPLSESDLFSAPPEPSECDNQGIPSSGRTTSSKVSALLKLLVESRDENPTTKSVVFSQFRKMLILLEEPLKEAGFGILRLDGSMSAKRRAQVIKEFGVRGSDAPTVLLASLRASGTGINLTVASRVYLFEPWWNPAVEEQAMDRVHRIGQKDDVKIVRMIARNSIEERILELQERKKKLARDAFGKRSAKDRREIGVDDLRTLMSL
ncbi:hypothetical protein HHK36_017131 [Tetracentron sinense]|uniref:Uncharacterized protein n=1 Tax=Tetracentron sinense TaxID=13715 RepID=A0A834Z2L5_TETSI|nr:hypothetical protein HHK36_017131 [Tetracentron sinense]